MSVTRARKRLQVRQHGQVQQRDARGEALDAIIRAERLVSGRIDGDDLCLARQLRGCSSQRRC